MCGQRFCGSGEGRAAGAEIYGGVIILHSLSDRSSDFLPELRRSDTLSFGAVAQKTTFHQDCRDPDLPQHMKPGMFDPAIEHRDAREDHCMNGGTQSDVMFILTVTG